MEIEKFEVANMMEKSMWDMFWKYVKKIAPFTKVLWSSFGK